MRKFGVDYAQLDATHIIEDSEDWLVVPAVIAREGVFPYPEGIAYKPAEELRDATWTADKAWLIGERHPDTLVLMDRGEIIGEIDRSRFANSAIKCHLHFDKRKTEQSFINDIKTGKRRGVSIGFFYDYCVTPGEWNGKHYDFVQRNILIDHVAAGVPRARCAPPFCGIGFDSVIRAAVDALRIAGDPYKSITELPESVKVLPKEAQQMFLKVVNSALEQYNGDEQKAFATAWAAVKKKWEKVDDKWVKKTEASDQEEEGELEKRREAARKRCGKYPISFKEGKGNLTKPAKYEDVDEDDFADPCNFKYPMVPDARLMNAWQRLSIEENRAKGGYSTKEWAWMKNRVKKRMEARGHEVTAESLSRLLKAAADEIERARRLLPFVEGHEV